MRHNRKTKPLPHSQETSIVMNINVDLSVFVNLSHVVGRVHGVIKLEVVPRQGELICFTFPNNDTKPLNMPGLPQLLRVENVVHSPQAIAEQVSLILEPVTLSSISEARAFMKFLEEGFGLYVEENPENDA